MSTDGLMALVKENRELHDEVKALKSQLEIAKKAIAENAVRLDEHMAAWSQGPQRFSGELIPYSATISRVDLMIDQHKAIPRAFEELGLALGRDHKRLAMRHDDIETVRYQFAVYPLGVK